MQTANSLEKSTADTRFWDKIAEKYANSPVADQALYERKLALTQQYLDSGSEILEIGCGTGSTALFHAPHVARVVATDFSPGMIDIANRKKAEANASNVEFLCSPLAGLDYEGSSFDAVLALSLLHLVEDYDAHIQRAYDLLRPGGVFVSSTPCLASSLWKLVLTPMKLLGKAPDVQIFDRETLESSITSKGFDIVDRIDPGKSAKGIFLVAQKPGDSSSGVSPG